MSIPVIKAITKRIRLRYGSTEAAATAAGVSPGVWSGYENADKPETTIPLGRLVDMSLTADEAAEATEAAARVQSMVRLAARDGQITEAEARPIRQAALEAKAQMHDVLKSVGRVG